MKKQILTFLIMASLSSCNNDDSCSCANNKLVGKWKLIEVLADPGDGSGTFNPIESNKILEFKNNNTVVTNTSMCNPFSNEIVVSGVYNYFASTIVTNCQNPTAASVDFEIENNNFLILTYISTEGYAQKYKRVY
ncbi:hypothetical protein [Flavobacterium sp. J27]|uniref:hypothetical protein n=1 Tax=Flavobacterium sp. J27 TaxID=2060419 RepID=UPI001030EABC|nr:hypothetical protein [Flavobacterium sp. J27]